MADVQPPGDLAFSCPYEIHANFRLIFMEDKNEFIIRFSKRFGGSDSAFE